MKIRFFLFFLLFVVNLNAQSWQEVFINFDAKSMAFNPYDSSMWLVKKYPAHIDKNGVFTEYNNTTTPIFNFVDFNFSTPVFTSDAVYSYTNGTNFFYKFDGTAFQKIYLPGNHTMSFNMSAYNDTLYLNVGNPNQTLMYYQDQLIGQSNFESPRLKKGTSRFYRSYANTVTYLDFNQNYLNYFYSAPDNQEIEDLEVKKGTDSLFFTSLDKILIADSTLLIDSITSVNSNQMPLLNPIRLRFDQNGKLWTLFANSTKISKLSMYDFNSQTWQQTTSISDILASHPEIDTNMVIGQIEIDAYNNVWLLLCEIALGVTTTKYFMLQQGDAPSWVGLDGLDNEEQIRIYPNPATTSFTISSVSDSFLGEKATLKDLSGKIVMEFELNELNHKVDVSQLKNGVYFVEINNGKGWQLVKFVKE